MKEKLTKNDSMSKSCSQICEGIFEHQDKLDVCVAAFKALLSRRGILQHYYHDWNMGNWRRIDMPVEVAWENWASNHDPEEWISEPFVWVGSSIPSSIWSALNIDWIEWLDLNIYNK